MEKLRVVHYVNQFFGGVGGEEAAHSPPEAKEGPVGPGEVLKEALGERGEVVATVICGDNYFAEDMERAAEEVFGLIEAHRPDLLIAGPAFNAGRYGPACGKVCQVVQERLGIPAVTGMYEENPGVDLFRRSTHIVETEDNVRGMGEAVVRMARLALKLHGGEQLRSPQEEGLIPKGIKKNVLSEQFASERAVDLLLKKIKGEPYLSEMRLPVFEKVPPAPPVQDISDALVAVVVEGGLVPPDNPDGIESARATRFAKYSITGIDSLAQGEFAPVSGGFEKSFGAQEPNRLCPVDVLRELEAEGLIGRLHDSFYTTTGFATSLDSSQNMGKAIAEELESAGVDAVLLVST
jgi:betaine reductase